MLSRAMGAEHENKARALELRDEGVKILAVTTKDRGPFGAAEVAAPPPETIGEN